MAEGSTRGSSERCDNDEIERRRRILQGFRLYVTFVFFTSMVLLRLSLSLSLSLCVCVCACVRVCSNWMKLRDAESGNVLWQSNTDL